MTKSKDLVVAKPGQLFRNTASIVLEYLRSAAPMGVWTITRVENDSQTHLMLQDNSYELEVGDSTPWSDTYCVHMVSGAGPRVAGDAASVDAYAKARVNEVIKIKAYAGTPIRDSDGSLFGVLCGLDPRARHDLAALEPVLNAMGEMLQVALAGDRDYRALAAALRQETELAATDHLTGLGNRRAWESWLENVSSAFEQLADPTVVVIIDLDDFKGINDGPGGHTAGDEALCAVANAIASVMREGDLVARIGGDEFGVILTPCTAQEAPEIVARIIAATERTGVNASAGWSRMRIGHGVEEVVEQADRAMYEAKNRAKEARSLASGD